MNISRAAANYTLATKENLICIICKWNRTGTVTAEPVPPRVAWVSNSTYAKPIHIEPWQTSHSISKQATKKHSANDNNFKTKQDGNYAVLVKPGSKWQIDEENSIQCKSEK